ncbi:relaxase/mobilization nuclease domain-containing protein [Hyphomonas atlantica corrig.]|uniref:relaxase/mobilization nuclease domain-containing protein n=1 Tax=Hyphomonas atlantica TaxID=1280948 RepID=UPI002354A022|nr:relaxase/mobilization nuclease domain-containing protein [Hyphomonas atlantica]
MIFVGNSRANGQNLARHLMSPENEHVTVQEISGFAGDDLSSAFKEAEATARGTRCQKYLFSLSLNPPASQKVGTETFLQTISQAEERLGLQGQPRAIVFHEKGDRRHCHVVWSRIDSEEMKAIPLAFTKRKLMELSKEIYLEHGWEMPEGFIQPSLRDPKNLTLAEWQQAKRVGQDARELKAIFQACWKQSDDQRSFARALQEHGLALAKGDRRGFVATDLNGEVYAIARFCGVKSKDVRERLGHSETLPSVSQAKDDLAKSVLPGVEKLRQAEVRKLAKVKEHQKNLLRKLTEKHRGERKSLLERQEARSSAELKVRQDRFNKGLRGLFDRITGAYSRTKKQNELEAYSAIKRDQKERDELVHRHLAEKRDYLSRQRANLQKAQRTGQQLKSDLDRLRNEKQRDRTMRDGPKR